VSSAKCFGDRIALTAGALAVLVAASAAFAADLPYKDVAQPQPQAARFNWAGFYMGLNGGGGFGKMDPLGAITDRFDNSSFEASGGVFGVTSGAQMQQGHLVMGTETDLDWANISGAKTISPTIAGASQGITFDMRSTIDWTMTARIRVGWAQDNWLLYGTTGLAMMGNTPHISNITLKGVPVGCSDINLPNCSETPLAGGLALGMGVEYGFAGNWSAKLEYMFIAQLQGANLQNANLIRLGINYHFGS
jgi:outer membrane immunogenic protein